MEAYASAERTPPAPEFRRATVPLTHDVTPVPVHRGSIGRETTSASAVLASLILDGLDDDDLAGLARRLVPHLSEAAAMAAAPGQAAYTVASLAVELGVSQRVVRSAITRHELAAVRRGSRWIISADAVHTWATASTERRRTSRTSTPQAPKAAGPSLRSVFCGVGHGGAR
ncbi:MAG: helix-turn-helix domain-containing protein [Solirubrobacteraceae bacterium]